MHESQGVTLVELMVALTLLAVLGALAVPSFHAVRHDAERSSNVNHFVHALFLARSEAIKRGEIVSICKSADQDTCSPPAVPWTAGWIVFVNHDRDEPPQRDPQEPLLAAYQGWAHGTITSNRAAYSFRPHTQGVVNGTVVFCDRRGAEQARAVIISHTGRPRVARRDVNGRPLRCPTGP